MTTVEQTENNAGVAPLCRAMNLSLATFYRQRNGRAAQTLAHEQTRSETNSPSKANVLEPVSHRALSAAERRATLEALHSPRFIDKTPYEVYAGLLDEGQYLCSIRTMYRILVANGEVRERRNQLRRPNYSKPELLATAPNQVWSWDITKLLGPATWTYFYLYVILDIFSRFVVGWLVATRESKALATRLISDTCGKQEIARGQLTLHADRGASMKSKTVALLLGDLGVTKTHSRPYVSNDNPFSESQFKTMKYRPEFPVHFGSIQDARAFCGPFFEWYNNEHYHSGLSLMTPKSVHYGQAGKIIETRQNVLRAAWQAHPERFVRGIARLLSRRGRALLVANQFVPYEKLAKPHFRSITVLTRQHGFKVLALEEPIRTG